MAKPKDRRYMAVSVLINTGVIVNFRQIFQFIPRKVVYSDLGVNYGRFRRLLEHPDLFTLREITILGTFFKIDPRKMIEIVYSQYEEDKRNRTPRRKKKDSKLGSRG